MKSEWESEDDNWTRARCNSTVNDAFSYAQKQQVKGSTFSVTMTLDTSTGKVIEVDFSFLFDKGFGTIPVDVYRKIEVDLKKNVWFTLTSTGKQLNYVKRGWRHEVK